MRTVLSLLACLLFAAAAIAQGADGATIARATDGHRLVRFAGAPDGEAALASVSQSLGLSDAHTWRVHREHTDRRGARHERFRQVYASLPVLGGEYVVHHYPTGRTTATGRAGGPRSHADAVRTDRDTAGRPGAHPAQDGRAVEGAEDARRL